MTPQLSSDVAMVPLGARPPPSETLSHGSTRVRCVLHTWCVIIVSYFVTCVLIA